MATAFALIDTYRRHNTIIFMAGKFVNTIHKIYDLRLTSFAIKSSLATTSGPGGLYKKTGVFYTYSWDGKA